MRWMVHYHHTLMIKLDQIFSLPCLFLTLWETYHSISDLCQHIIYEFRVHVPLATQGRMLGIKMSVRNGPELVSLQL